MLCNLALWDRAIRFILSVFILAYAIAGGPFWFYVISLYGLTTAGFGLCPIYSYFRFRTLN
jgi:hypothetical protein